MPNTSPITSVTSYPGRSFMVLKIMSFPFISFDRQQHTLKGW